MLADAFWGTIRRKKELRIEKKNSQISQIVLRKLDSYDLTPYLKITLFSEQMPLKRPLRPIPAAISLMSDFLCFFIQGVVSVKD